MRLAADCRSCRGRRGYYRRPVRLLPTRAASIAEYATGGAHLVAWAALPDIARAPSRDERAVRAESGVVAPEEERVLVLHLTCRLPVELQVDRLVRRDGSDAASVVAAMV